MLIVGLGNRGDNYQNTRHNIGFVAVDAISRLYNFTWSYKSKFNADIAVGECILGKVILCKPMTFMNLSGLSVQSLVSFYKIPTESVIVIHDDIDLALAKIKHKIGGSSGGHNGIKSIDKSIGKNYHRLRIGIGRPHNLDYDISDYVLGKFTKEEEQLLVEPISQLVDKIQKHCLAT